MSTILFDVTTFRAEFPAFSNATTYPTLTLQANFDTASLYISNQYRGYFCGQLTLAQRTRCLNLMTAHLTAINDLISQGQVVGIMVSATVDKVSVNLAEPPKPNQWQYWLQSTPYGQQLLALLQVKAAGGLYVGGRPVLSSFRR